MLTTSTQLIREHNGVHTCDKRRTRSDIHARFPEYGFEAGFTEDDELWTPDYRETHGDIDRRARHVLDIIFQNDREQCRCRSSLSLCLLVGSRRGSSSSMALSYIAYGTWRLHQRFLAHVRSPALDPAYGRFVPASISLGIHGLIVLSRIGVLPVVVKGSGVEGEWRN